MNFAIKKIGPNFIDSLIETQKNDGFKHVYYLTEERLLKLFKNGEEFFGAFTKDGQLVGFVSINTDVVRLRIHFLFVDKEYQGKGIGKSLLNQVILIANKLKIKNIYTYTEIDSPLEVFLLKHGFEKAGYFKRRFGDKDANILSINF